MPSRGLSGGPEPEDAMWVREIDYVGAWQEASSAADLLNGASGGAARATPHAGPRGEAVVWLRPDDARRIASTLARIELLRDCPILRSGDAPTEHEGGTEEAA
ncbi:hypothetical protein GCM10009801_46580 [Streptomyces albiaxialis]|uniref:YCII-related domain-containing protein n=1 Tax=Streptomyces albiaxialis TaxID=329523 RepID=A0ABN2W7F3_9ACTN